MGARRRRVMLPLPTQFTRREFTKLERTQNLNFGRIFHSSIVEKARRMGKAINAMPEIRAAHDLYTT